MLKLAILAVGEKMPSWVNDGASSYLQRLRGNTVVSLIEISAKKRGKQVDIKRILHDEGEAIIKHVPSGSWLVCLDRSGKAHSSLDVAEKITHWQQQGQNVTFVIGGPEGLASDVMTLADEVWTLSKMTYSHHVARVMLAEQLYRGWSITENLPYHR